jgi:hypothetical protein
MLANDLMMFCLPIQVAPRIMNCLGSSTPTGGSYASNSGRDRRRTWLPRWAKSRSRLTYRTPLSSPVDRAHGSAASTACPTSRAHSTGRECPAPLAEAVGGKRGGNGRGPHTPLERGSDGRSVERTAVATWQARSTGLASRRGDEGRHRECDGGQCDLVKVISSSTPMRGRTDNTKKWARP